MKIPKARKLDSGMWHIQLRDADRKSHCFTAMTKSECEAMALDWKMNYRLGKNPLRPQRLTLSDAIDEYIALRTNVLSPASISAYRDIQKQRFKAYMRCDLKSLDCQRMINSEAALVSPKTVRSAWGFVSAVLRSNNIVPPSVRLPQLVKKEHPFLQPEQIRTFIKAIEGEHYEIPMLLALHGMRRSEVLALKKSDVYDGIIHIRRSMVASTDGLVMKEGNKTVESSRDVPVFIPRLSELIDGTDTQRLCPNSAEAILKRLNAICEANSLPKVGWHGLRHSFASLCYHLGLSEMETMRLGGWSDPSVMRKIYTHLADTDKRASEEKLRGFFE